MALKTRNDPAREGSSVPQLSFAAANPRNDEPANPEPAKVVRENNTNNLRLGDPGEQPTSTHSLRFLDSSNPTAGWRSSIGSSIFVDYKSIVSRPLSLLADSASKEFRKLTNEAISFYRRGELANASKLYKQSKEFLPMGDGNVYVLSLQIDIHIAAIALRQGSYLEAESKFRAIFGDLKTSTFTNESIGIDLRIDTIRWLSVALFKQGRYDVAAEYLESLLGEKSETRARLLVNVILQIQVRRDLALSWAHLGYYDGAEDQLHEAQRLMEQVLQRGSEKVECLEHFSNSGRPPQEAIDNKIRAKSNSVFFTAAIVQMLRGVYPEALENCSKAYQDTRRWLGSRHIKTLEMASLRSLLLARTSQLAEAETDCQDSLQVMTKELGKDHPLTLETKGHLIFICIEQSRFIQAKDTAKSLCQLFLKTLGPEHPQVLRVRGQLARTYMLDGEYTAAKQELSEIVKASEDLGYGWHPETWLYQLGLARAFCLSGMIDAAKQHALRVLQKQRSLYHASNRAGKTSVTQSWTKWWVSELSQPPVAEQDRAEDLLSHFQSMRDMGRTSEMLRLHPSFLSTFEVLAEIEMQKIPPDILRAKEILTAIIGCQQDGDARGKSSALFLDYEYRLAILERTYAREELEIERSSQRLMYVLRERTRMLGEHHATTLVARREQIMSLCRLGIWDNAESIKATDDLRELENMAKSEPLDRRTSQQSKGLAPHEWLQIQLLSEKIATFQECQMGQVHPEALKSLTWVFILQVLLGQTDEAEKTCQIILERLRRNEVRQQRLDESLRMEHKLGLIYFNAAFHFEATKLFRDLVENITSIQSQGEVDPLYTHSFECLRESIQKDMVRAKNKALVDWNEKVSGDERVNNAKEKVSLVESRGVWKSSSDASCFE